MPWRRRASERSLGREGRIWTLWSVGIVVTFGAARRAAGLDRAAGLPRVGDLPRATGSPCSTCRRGAGRRGVKPIGSARADQAERTALGLLGDLLGHEARDLLTDTGLALQRGRLGAWLVGEEGAILVRPGGHRVHCFCVRVGRGRRPAAPATASRICCSPCARTSRGSPRSRTGTSRAPRGASGWSCRSGAAPALSDGPRSAFLELSSRLDLLDLAPRAAPSPRGRGASSRRRARDPRRCPAAAGA